MVLRLPSPFHLNNGVPHCNMASLPYLQALLHTSSHVVDAIPIINGLSTLQPSLKTDAKVLNEVSKKEMLDRFRFSIRFNFQGGRGFDIIKNCLETTNRDLGPTHKKSKKHDERRLHLSRVIAPVGQLLQGVQSTIERVNSEQEITRLLRFVHPINLQQQQAVLEIVNKCHGPAPYIIQGPAGTGVYRIDFSEIQMLA